MPKKIRVNVQRDLLCVDEKDFGFIDDQDRDLGARLAVFRETLTEAENGTLLVPYDRPRIRFVTVTTYTRDGEPYGGCETENFGVTVKHVLENALRTVSAAKRRYAKKYG